MILIDTGYFIALFDAADSLHRRAGVWAQVVHEPLVVPEYVLLEAINYFSRRALRPRAVALADTVRADPSYELVAATDGSADGGIDLFRRVMDKDWSLTDCVSIHIMRSRGITRALTYDHHFEQAGFEALMRREPSGNA